MLSEWARYVGEKDQILHLGDVCMGAQGNRNRWYDLIARMPGEKFLILGNHDRVNDNFSRAGFIIVPEFVYRGIAFSHRPLTEDRYDDDGNDWHVNIHGHTHANDYTPEHDGILLGNRTYINVCVEHTDLKPRQLGTIFPVPKRKVDE